MRILGTNIYTVSSGIKYFFSTRNFSVVLAGRQPSIHAWSCLRRPLHTTHMLTSALYGLQCKPCLPQWSDVQLRQSAQQLQQVIHCYLAKQKIQLSVDRPLPLMHQAAAQYLLRQADSTVEILKHNMIIAMEAHSQRLLGLLVYQQQELLALSVHGASQKKGLASCLIATLINHLAQQEDELPCVLKLQVARRNARAIGFYQGLGAYVEYGRLTGDEYETFHLEGSSAIAMINDRMLPPD